MKCYRIANALALGFLVTAILVSLGAVCGPVEEQLAEETPTADTGEHPTAGTGATPQVPAVSTTPEDGSVPTVTPGPTEVSVQPMVIGGTMWVDARPVEGEVLAFVGTVLCGRGQSVRLGGDSLPFLVVAVETAAQHAGCGQPGAQIQLEVNGRRVNEPIEWAPGPQPQAMYVVGPSFAILTGSIGSGTRPSGVVLVPYVEDSACGTEIVPQMLPRGVPTSFLVIVDPDELTPGCGRYGSIVRLIAMTDEVGSAEVARATWSIGLTDLGAVAYGSTPVAQSPTPAVAE